MLTYYISGFDRFSGNIVRVRWGVSSLHDYYIYSYGRPATNDPATRDVDETCRQASPRPRSQRCTNDTQWVLLGQRRQRLAQMAARPAGQGQTVHARRYQRQHLLGAQTHVEERDALHDGRADRGHDDGEIRTRTTPLLWPDYAWPLRDPSTGQGGIPLRNDAQGNPAGGRERDRQGQLAPINPMNGFARDFARTPSCASRAPCPNRRCCSATKSDCSEGPQSSGGDMGKMRFTKGCSITYPWCAKGSDDEGDRSRRSPLGLHLLWQRHARGD